MLWDIIAILFVSGIIFGLGYLGWILTKEGLEGVVDKVEDIAEDVEEAIDDLEDYEFGVDLEDLGDKLKSMTKAELEEFAHTLGIKVDKRKKKDDMIQKIVDEKK